MRIIVNGCFDCFHDGHKYLLECARRMASSVVIVLLNDDSSVKELKGDGRPKDNYPTRKYNIEAFWGELLASNLFSHHIFGQTPYLKIYSFSTEEELEESIDMLQPDMILKGNDRPDVREVVGSDRWPVCIIPRLKDDNGEDISTTRKISE